MTIILSSLTSSYIEHEERIVYTCGIWIKHDRFRAKKMWSFFRTNLTQTRKKNRTENHRYDSWFLFSLCISWRQRLHNFRKPKSQSSRNILHRRRNFSILVLNTKATHTYSQLNCLVSSRVGENILAYRPCYA